MSETTSSRKKRAAARGRESNSSCSVGDMGARAAIEGASRHEEAKRAGDTGGAGFGGSTWGPAGVVAGSWERPPQMVAVAQEVG